jgi:hypothetical protein
MCEVKLTSLLCVVKTWNLILREGSLWAIQQCWGSNRTQKRSPQAPPPPKKISRKKWAWRFALVIKYHMDVQIKVGTMTGVQWQGYKPHLREMINPHIIVVGTLQWKKSLGRPRRRWGTILKMCVLRNVLCYMDANNSCYRPAVSFY